MTEITETSPKNLDLRFLRYLTSGLGHVEKKDGKDVWKLNFKGHVSLTASLIIVTAIFHSFIYVAMDKLQQNWISCELSKNELSLNESLAKDASPAEKSRLAQQFITIQDRTVRHCNIMTFFYKQYFISLSIGGTAALITFLCIFFVSKEGWEKSNNALINLSITAFGVTTFYLNLTQIFQQQQNLDTSQKLYASYQALGNNFNSSLVQAVPQILSQPSDPQSSPPITYTTPITYTSLILATDERLNSLGFIKLGFDPTPITELQNKAGSIFGESQASEIQSLPQPSSPATTTAPKSKQ